MTFLFQDLNVYQKSVDFADQINQLTETFPSGTYHIRDQLNRAALSIPLNIAEGNGRWHKPDRRQFFWIARGSTHECVPILEICLRRKLISKETYKHHFDQLEEIAKMIAGLIKGLENRIA
jgi:four helix bundle protein